MHPDTSKCSAIVADDSSLIRDVLRSNLSASFGHVHLATDGLEAVEAARALRAALVILDYRMKRLNGIEACREIRELPDYANVPVVLLTAYDDDRLRREADRAGVTFVFPKPVIYAHLMETLAPYLRAHLEPVPGDDELTRGRALLNQRRRIEAETDIAKRRYTGLAERATPFLGAWKR